MTRSLVVGLRWSGSTAAGRVLHSLLTLYRLGVRLLSPLAEGAAKSDELLFAAYRGGNPAAFDQLFERYSASLLRFMRRQVRRPEDASELVQQTFLQLHRARNDFREGALLRPWLYTIALNLRREYFRRRARRPESSSDYVDRWDEESLTPEDDLEAMQVAQAVRAALEQLPEGQRTVIEMHWFEGLSFPEIAGMLGLGLSAVKVRAHRGYSHLRSHLGCEASPSRGSGDPS
ncbi:MAG: sigma-70 family RNA polymerase sigma factor [Myxococcota bacterium]|nr:sigma-70 family RNA polymerase sigma factor [Myxococcota bacterium]